MTVEQFLDLIRSEESIEFEQTMAVIDEHFDYTPTQFYNGKGEARVSNEAGQNGGSCKIFAFAQMQGLDQQQTLRLFGRFYAEDVLLHPEGNDHANIRNFIRFGWEGIEFSGQALQPR